MGAGEHGKTTSGGRWWVRLPVHSLMDMGEYVEDLPRSGGRSQASSRRRGTARRPWGSWWFELLAALCHSRELRAARPSSSSEGEHRSPGMGSYTKPQLNLTPVLFSSPCITILSARSSGTPRPCSRARGPWPGPGARAPRASSSVARYCSRFTTPAAALVLGRGLRARASHEDPQDDSPRRTPGPLE